MGCQDSAAVQETLFSETSTRPSGPQYASREYQSEAVYVQSTKKTVVSVKYKKVHRKNYDPFAKAVVLVKELPEGYYPVYYQNQDYFLPQNVCLEMLDDSESSGRPTVEDVCTPVCQATLNALCLLRGDGVQRDEVEAYNQLVEIALAGCPEAQFYVGECCRNEWGTPRDCAEAERWFKQAAAQGHALAALRLGVCYLTKFCDFLDKRESHCENRPPSEQLDRGQQLFTQKNDYSGPDSKLAFALFERAARAGVAAAQWQLSQCYFAGCGVPANAGSGRKWLLRAAVNGYVDDFDANLAELCRSRRAQRLLSVQLAKAAADTVKAAANTAATARLFVWMCMENNVKPENTDEITYLWAEAYRESAYQQLQRAADAGLESAYLIIARRALILEHNELVSAEYTQTQIKTALEVVKAAAARGDASAQYALGVFYSGEPRNAAIAVELLSRSARNGCAAAATRLAELYATGQLVQQSDSRAERLFQLAAELGSASAQYQLALQLLDAARSDKFYQKDAEKPTKYPYRLAGYIAAAGKHDKAQQKHVEPLNRAECAVKYLHRAADQKYAPAMRRLAICYKNGVGVQKDAETADEWRSAAIVAEHEN